jgi:hypothetical protein
VGFINPPTTLTNATSLTCPLSTRISIYIIQFTRLSGSDFIVVIVVIAATLARQANIYSPFIFYHCGDQVPVYASACIPRVQFFSWRFLYQKKT